MTKLSRQPAPKPRKTVTLAEVRRIAKARGYSGVTVLPYMAPNGQRMVFLSTPHLGEPGIAIDHPSRSVALAQMKAALMAAGGGK